jgi:hypothetical protein
MSSTTGLINQDPYEIMKKYPDARRNQQWFTLPTKVIELQTPSFASRIKARLDIYDRLIAVTDAAGVNIDYWEIDNNVEGFMAFLTTGGQSRFIDCTTDHATFSDRGYISSPVDWLNIEGTIFVKAKSFIDLPGYNPVITLKGRTGYHPPNGMCCQGAAYGCNAYVKTNIIDLFREVYHDNKVIKEQKGQSVTTFADNYFGIKFCLYNETINGVKQVINEMYICPSDLAEDMSYNWLLVNRKIDFPGSGWARGGKKCGAITDDYPIYWAGPRAIFQWSGFNKLIFKYASWREIDPYTGFRTGGYKGGRRPTIVSCRPGTHYDQISGQCLPD